MDVAKARKILKQHAEGKTDTEVEEILAKETALINQLSDLIIYFLPSGR